MLHAAHPAHPVPARPTADLPAAVVHLAGTIGRAGEHAVFAYDPAVAASRARCLREALPTWTDLAFAVKANGHAPVLEALAPHVDGFEVASRSELESVCDIPGSRRIVAAGPGKTPDLLAALIAAGADPINAESELELERIAVVARRAGRRVRVTLRVNPETTTLRGALQMGGTSSPFGIDERAVPRALSIARSFPELDVVGFHIHAVSGNLDAAAHVDYIAWCLEFSRATAAAHSVDLRLVDAGGGLGVLFDGAAGLDGAALGRGLHDLEPPAGVRLILEPGRWLAAPCGWYLAPVTDLKVSVDTTYAVLRGGINHFALPASWDLLHRPAIVAVDDWDHEFRRPEVRDRPVSIVGELCTPEDALAHGIDVARLRAGDVVVFPDAGAYGYEFALPDFLGHPRARRVLVASDRYAIAGAAIA